MKNKTLDYYKKNSKTYIDSTFNLDMSSSYLMLEKYLSKGNKILDVGCGSGRDSKYFMSKGYDVVAIDPVKEFIDHAKEIGIDAYLDNALTMKYNNEFDAIWACASLLHVEEHELKNAFQRCYDALKDGGIMFTTFKYGDYVGEDSNNRYFIYLNENNYENYIGKFKVLETSINEDSMNRTGLKWINLVLKK